MKPTPKPTAATVARILKALPRTADGVPIVPGMMVYGASALPALGREIRKYRVYRIYDDKSCAAQVQEPSSAVGMFCMFENREKFSTRAAALAEVKRRNGGKR